MSPGRPTRLSALALRAVVLRASWLPLIPVAVVLFVAAVARDSGDPPADPAPLAPTAALDGSSTPATPVPTAAVFPASSRRVTLAAVGDVMLARSVGAAIEQNGPEVVFAGVSPLLTGADIAVANLETSISDRGHPAPKGYTFRAPLAAAAALTQGGIDLVSLANNHTLDFGAEALEDTLAAVEAEGVATVGAGTADRAFASRVVERNGLRVAFVGLADVPAEGPGFSRQTWEARDGRPGIAWADLDTVTTAVRAARDHADLVVVMLHFGIEYATDPSPAQRRLAEAAIDAGAILVIGSHPHVLQPVERYENGLIAFSLGNFVFDGFEGEANTTAILRVVLTPEGIAAWELVSAVVGWDGLPSLP